MKILAYCVRPDEIDSFKNFSEKYGHTVDLIPDSFGPSVAHLAKGYDGISILGNDTCNREALEKIELKFINNACHMIMTENPRQLYREN